MSSGVKYNEKNTGKIAGVNVKYDVGSKVKHMQITAEAGLN